METVLGTGSKREGALQINPSTLPGVKLISQEGEYKLWSITNPTSLSLLGEGTKWCTRKSYKPCQAEDYINNYGIIFIISKGNKLFSQITSDLDQIMDINDDRMNMELYNDLMKNLFKPIESYFLKTPLSAYNYARYIIRGRWSEAEPIIMQDPESAYRYAKEIIKDRWPEAEPYIMKNPEWAYKYTKHVIKGRWPEAEPHIVQSPKWAYYYALNVIKGRWPEAEPYIMKDPIWAEEYKKFFK